LKIFKDSVGREWEIVVNIAAVKRVRDLTKIDLLDLADGGTITKLTDDPVALCDVLWALCREQAKGWNTTDEQFGQSLVGDAIEQATDALLQELIDFFPTRKRTILAKAFATVKTIQAKAHTLAMERMDDPALLAKIEASLTSGKLLPNVPGSPESTPPS
jgi:hypothetical protein